jgi:hypothetical protein
VKPALEKGAAIIVAPFVAIALVVLAVGVVALVVLTAMAVISYDGVGLQRSNPCMDVQCLHSDDPSSNKIEGTQHVRKHVVPPPRSPHYERWVDLPMNKPVRGTSRWYRHALRPSIIKCKDLGKPNRFDTLSEWDEPRISTARLCVRQGYHR